MANRLIVDSVMKKLNTLTQRREFARRKEQAIVKKELQFFNIKIGGRLPQNATKTTKFIEKQKLIKQLNNQIRIKK